MKLDVFRFSDVHHRSTVTAEVEVGASSYPVQHVSSSSEKVMHKDMAQR
jgi:hypothetical protein